MFSGVNYCMFVSKRKIKGRDYFYLEDRINGKRVSFFLGGKKQAEEKVETAFDAAEINCADVRRGGAIL